MLSIYSVWLGKRKSPRRDLYNIDNSNKRLAVRQATQPYTVVLVKQ